MRRQGWLYSFFPWATLLLVVSVALAQAEKPRPEQDDAELHDVCFFDQTGWAVGNSGALWKSDDGGETWRWIPTGVTCPLRSVWFQDAMHGWVAGGEIGPYAVRPTGVLLATVDGGETWRPAGQVLQHTPRMGTRTTPPQTTFPRLHVVRFFSPDHGLVAGDPDDVNLSGVLSTTDGGVTWNPVPGTAIGNWRSADFVGWNTGAAVGPRGALGLITDGRILPARNAVPGLPGLNGVALSKTSASWLVGDGGTVLTSANAGTSWEDPPKLIPEAARRIFDFKTVAARGLQVWIAGSPGSAVWYSPDEGLTWYRQRTGQTLPISRLRMFTDTEGCAVGSLGTILKTTDGGRSWRVVQGENRRLAVLAIHGQSDRISWELLTACSGEEGYRSRVHVLSRSDVGPEGSSSADRDVRLSEAAVAAGGAGVQIDWQYPLLTPGLEQNYDKLVEDWNQRAEGRLKETLLAQFVRDLRTWRPNVVIIDRPTERDSLSRLIHELVTAACEQAKDPTRAVDLSKFAVLEPWSVDRICERLPEGEVGPIALDPWRYLPRLSRALSSACEGARARITSAPNSDLFTDGGYGRRTRETYQAAGDPGLKDVFAGLVLSPGSDARRELALLSEKDLVSGQKRAERQRNFASYTQKYLSDPRHAGQLVAQLDDVTRDLSPAEAAQQLADLAQRHLAEGQWELAELQLIQLLERYPQEPVAHRAGLRLMEFWGGTETSWRRIRKSEVEHRQAKFNATAASQAIEQALAWLDERAAQFQQNGLPLQTDGETGGVVPASGELAGAKERIFVKSKFGYWLRHANQVASELEVLSPGLLQPAGSQFALAHVHAALGNGGKAAEIYRKFYQDSTHPWWLAAAGELWLTQPRGTLTDRPIGVCRYTPVRPVLDGLLSDNCWLDAAELPLTSIPGEKPDPDHPFAMLSYDAKYLYVAARFPRSPGFRTDMPVKGRQHDDDLSEFDRLTILLDVDRDYATHYRLSIDQRGCTAEDCWSDKTWNPQWFVAADGDDTHWRFEAAIPLDELVPELPTSGHVWNVSLVRTIPTVGLQGWSHPATREPHLEASGLVRFER